MSYEFKTRGSSHNSQLTTHNSRHSSKQRSVSTRRDYPQRAIVRRRGDSPASRSLQESCLDQVRLVEVLESAAVFSHRGRDRGDSDRPAAELLDDGCQDPAVELIEAVLVHLQPREGLAGGREITLLLPGDLGEVAQAAQQAVGDPRRAAAAGSDLAGGLGQ